ncbi:MAG: ankyrin repeat domain-containing protein, partial [Alphaproteobacteria bacterium]|nr:ankyrin repeat domain-containing protein [Alphaproteobacteria bacterium]
MEKDWQEAALAGDVVRIKALLEASGDARDSRDRYGQTAVMLAAVHGREAVVRALIEAGADLDVTAKYGLSA